MNLYKKFSNGVTTETFDGDIADMKQIIYLVKKDSKEVWRRAAPRGTKPTDRKRLAQEQENYAKQLSLQGDEHRER